MPSCLPFTLSSLLSFLVWCFLARNHSAHASVGMRLRWYRSIAPSSSCRRRCKRHGNFINLLIDSLLVSPDNVFKYSGPSFPLTEFSFLQCSLFLYFVWQGCIESIYAIILAAFAPSCGITARKKLVYVCGLTTSRRKARIIYYGMVVEYFPFFASCKLRPQRLVFTYSSSW